MAGIVAIGEPHRVEGFALAGVEVRSAEGRTSVHDAWDELGPDVGLVILTAAAEAALGARLLEREDMVWVSLPG